MLTTRRLLREDITYEDAKSNETNILHKLSYWDQREKLLHHLSQNFSLIQAITAHHLGSIPEEACQITELKEWLHGSFNLCIPIDIVTGGGRFTNKRVIIRFPLPYRVGEFFRPGNADEKLRCEAGTYAWLQQNCPSVPIPGLHGFGLSTGQTFTALENLPFVTRYGAFLYRRVLSWFGFPTPSRYVRHDIRHKSLSALGTGYLIIDFIEKAQGEMLSKTWNEKHNETKLRNNFFRDLCRIILDVARIPLPRIGSFIIDDDGFLLLANRPLSLEIHDLENEEIPVDIPRHLTYTSVDSYVVDILSIHDSRLRHQPNAVNHEKDCIYQMSALAAMKMMSSLFFRRDLRNGPFVFQFGDLHQSNIFVDENWRIKYLVDLEWACSRPIEMLHPPSWLTNQAIDKMDAGEYDAIRREFMDILEEVKQETSVGNLDITSLSSIMKRGWEMGTFWYALALQSPTGLFRTFYDHIQPKLAHGHEDDPDFYRIVMYYWTRKFATFIREKAEEKKNYDLRLREAFEDKDCTGSVNVP